MGKKYKIILGIVFLPLTILFFVIKFIWKILRNKFAYKYLNTINIEKIDSLDGRGLEDFLYYYLTSLGFKVKKTKHSHDYGADLIVEFQKKIIVIQCKLYYNHSVGNSAIQEIATAKNYYNALRAIVITNSYFTNSAITLSKASDVTLIDRNIFASLLGKSKANTLSQIKSLFI